MLGRCGVIFHQTYNQRIPTADKEVADKAKHKDLLGYHDIRLGNEADDRMHTFVQGTLPAIAEEMRGRFDEYSDLLSEWAFGFMDYTVFAARIRRRAQGTNEEFDAE